MADERLVKDRLNRSVIGRTQVQSHRGPTLQSNYSSQQNRHPHQTQQQTRPTTPLLPTRSSRAAVLRAQTARNLMELSRASTRGGSGGQGRLCGGLGAAAAPLCTRNLVATGVLSRRDGRGSEVAPSDWHNTNPQQNAPWSMPHGSSGVGVSKRESGGREHRTTPMAEDGSIVSRTSATSGCGGNEPVGGLSLAQARSISPSATSVMSHGSTPIDTSPHDALPASSACRVGVFPQPL
jgi:hypothetical protein